MGIFDFFRPKAADAIPLSKKANGQVIHFLGGGDTGWMKRNGRAYAREGYSINVVVFRCVDIISKSMGMIPVELVDVKTGKEVDNHPIKDLLLQPNPYQGWSSFIAAATSFRLITGAGPIEALRQGRGLDGSPDGTGEPVALLPWRPYNIEPLLGKTGDGCWETLRGYKFEEGNCRRIWEVNPLTGQSNLLHWHTFDPVRPYTGMSPLEAAAWSVDQHNSSSEWNQSLLKNSAQPSGALVLPAGSVLSDDQYADLKDQIREEHSGANNAGEPLLLGGGMEWHPMALSPKDMDWLAGRKIAAGEIAGAYGVPLQVIPIPGEQTFANYQEARLALLEDTVIPLMDDFLDELNHWLLPMYGLDQTKVQLQMNLNDVPALASRRKERWEMVNSSNLLTIDEAREAIGYDPLNVTGSDQLWVPSGKLPLDLSAGLPTGATEGANAPEQAPTAEEGAATATAEGANVQATALNGGQVTALQGLLTSVANGTLTEEAAVIAITLSFPLFDEDDVRAMVASAATTTPPPEEQTEEEIAEGLQEQGFTAEKARKWAASLVSKSC